MRKATIRRGKALRVTAVALLCMLVAAGCSSVTKHQSTLSPKGKVAKDDLHIFTAFFIVASIIGIAVILMTIFVAVRFRERPGNENPVQTHGNTTLEISWTIAPALILMVMAVFTVKLIWDQAQGPTKDAVKVTVTGKQWWWEFTYTNVTTHQVITANELHIPEGRQIYFTLKSDNVIHSFWFPTLGGKKDVVPGHWNTWSYTADNGQATDGHPAVYYGQCAEYCGLSHADMRMKVFVETQHDFNAWYESQTKPWTAQQLATFKQWDNTYTCSTCHHIQGLNGDAINRGPNLTHLADRTTFASATFDLNYNNLWQWIWDAPRHGTGDFGKYNECPNRGPKGQTDFSSPCKVGMPSFKNDPVKPMSQATAKEIANFLLSTKNFNGQ